MNTQSIHEVLTQTQAGELTFPNVVSRLLEAGVESYLCDLTAGTETLYSTTGETIQEKYALSLDPVAPDFSPDAVVAAIRAAQADTIRYPEFLRRAAAAGVTAYWAFLTGRQVLYLGRRGEQHIERFPGGAS